MFISCIYSVCTIVVICTAVRTTPAHDSYREPFLPCWLEHAPVKISQRIFLPGAKKVTHFLVNKHSAGRDECQRRYGCSFKSPGLYISCPSSLTGCPRVKFQRFYQEVAGQPSAGTDSFSRWIGVASVTCPVSLNHVHRKPGPVKLVW